MADADEDLIPRGHPSSSASNDPYADLEDEAQDFRFLASLTSNPKATGALPKRGEKDFEPNPTQSQSDTLAASREAMRQALSVQRVYAPQNSLVGQYLPDPQDWRWDTRPDTRGKGGRGGRCVVVENFATTHSRSFGTTDYRNWTWFLPEEALFLLERGTLDIRWPDENVRAFMKGGTKKPKAENANKTGVETGAENVNARSDDDDDDDDDDDNNNNKREQSEAEEADIIDSQCSDGLRKKPPPPTFKLQIGEMPMSLQGAYASFIGKSGLTTQRFNVYTGLRRLGYIVQRAPTWDEGQDGNDDEQSLQGYASNPAVVLINRLVAYLFTWKPAHYQPRQGPLIHPTLYSSYHQIFRTLSLIPYYDPKTASLLDKTASTAARPRSPFNISWLVYKPNPNARFRKTEPPPPDFRVAVLDARTTSIPTAAELGALLNSMPPDALPKDKRMEQRLKHGIRNVILAVVDCGLVSYLRAADMCSGSEGRVFETKTAARGGKRGGPGKNSHRRGGRGGRGGTR